MSITYKITTSYNYHIVQLPYCTITIPYNYNIIPFHTILLPYHKLLYHTITMLHNSNNVPLLFHITTIQLPYHTTIE